MKTRFDVTGVWVRTYTSPVKISDMSTPHILNAVKMFIQNPVRTLSMLITDIESASFSETIWTPYNDCDKMQSLKNVTSIRYFCVPCKPSKANGQRTRNYPHHDPDRWRLFKEYNAQDVVTEMEIEQRLSALPSVTMLQNFTIECVKYRCYGRIPS